jgi:hypothetical protein
MSLAKLLARPSRLCEKSNEVSSPRKRGSNPANINWILAESSTTLRVIDPWGVFDPLSWE